MNLKIRELHINFTSALFLIIGFFLGVNSVVAQTDTEFNSSGTFKVPAGVISVKIEAWGAGGAGGGSRVNKYSGGGGGGGAYTVNSAVTVVPGTIHTVTVGAGGTGSSGTGTDGGASSFISVIANGGGGGGGASGTNLGYGGAGGSAGTYKGGRGNSGSNSSNVSGGGGGSSSGTGTGGVDATNAKGAIAPFGGGDGGDGGSPNSSGVNGTIPGGGGGGAGDVNGTVAGGAGANGKIKVTFTCPTSAGNLSGIQTICLNGKTNFSSTVAGGSWSSSDISKATVNPSTGEVTAESAGSAVIRYTLTKDTYCTTTYIAERTVTVQNIQAPTAPGSPRADSPTCTGFMVQWGWTSNAVKYYLDVSTNSGFSTFVSVYNNLDVGDVLKYGLTGLNPGTTYYYRVRADNSCGTSPSSATMNFATSPIPITAPVATNATDIICYSAQLNWNVVANATGLYLDIATDSNFTEYVGIYHNYNVEYNNGSFYVSNLPSGDLYYRVRAYNSCATTGYSNVGTFRTTAPLGGTVSPAQTICSGTSPTTNLTLSGYATANTKILKWQKANDAAFTTNVSDIAETTNILTVNKMGAITENTYFRAFINNPSPYCNSYSSPVLITVNNGGSGGVTPGTPGAIAGTINQCSGLANQVYSIVAVANATIYNWTVPTGWAITAGEGTTSISVTTGAAGQNGNISVSAGNGCSVSQNKTLAVTVGSCINKWKGSVSTNWNTPENWTQNFVPAADASIVFDDAPVNHLVLDQDRSVTNILNAQATYRVVCNGKKLTLKGDVYFTNGAQIDALATNSTLEFAGSTVQTIESGQYLNEKMFNLNIDNAAGVSLNTNFALDNNLTINSAKKFIIDAAKSLTVTGTIANSAATSGFVLKSTAVGTASLIHNTNNVPATVERYISGAKEAWHFLSTPVSNQTIAGSSLTPSGTYGNGTGYDLYLWNEPTPCWVYHKNDEGGLTIDPKNPKWPAVHSSTKFIPGCGYLYSVQATNPTTEFAGNLNNGSIIYSITNSILGEDPNVRGFNLIGNPYPSAIDWKAASGWTRDALVVSGGGGFDMWIWNPVTSNYGVLNSLKDVGTNGVTRNIAPMQGFFVRAATSGTVSMTNSIRGNSGASNWMRMKTSKAEMIKVQIASNEGNGSDEILLQFGAPSNEAGAAKLFSTVTTAPSLFLNHEKKELSVLNLTDIIENSSVPLLFKAGKDGNYALSISSESASYDVLLLEDKKTNTITDLNANATYQFKGSVKDAADRFVLHFVPIIPEVVNLPATIYYDGNEINVDLTLVEGQTDIKVYDMLGRLLVDKKVEGKMIHSFAIKVKNEVYIVLASSKGKSISRKVLVY